MQVFYTHYDETVDSSAIQAVWYDDIEWKLFVRFYNGTIAGYQNVPESIYKVFMESPSIGRFYNTSILGKFTGVDTDNIEFVERLITFDKALDQANAQETVVQDDPVTKGDLDSAERLSLTQIYNSGITVSEPRLWEKTALAQQIRLYDDVDDVPEYTFVFAVKVTAYDEDSAFARLHDGQFVVDSITKELS